MLRSSSLKNVVGTLAVVAGIASPAVAEPPANSRLVALADAGAEVSALPDGAAGFDGQVVGIVAGRRDDGAVLFRVVKVQQVWPNANKSTNPDSLNGKTIVVRANAGPDSVQAQFVGKLQVNDESRLNIRQYEGSLFVVTELTEEQRKMAARETPTARESSADAKDDLTKSPPELYGLSGRVIGRLVSRDPEQGELTLKIVKVDRVWKGNKAKEPNSAEGRTLKIEGVFGKFLDTLLTLKAGDGVQIEVKHVKGDNLVFLGEELMKVVIEDEDSTLRDSSPSTSPTTKPDGASAEIPAGLRGFRGIMIGSLVSKDTEAGTLVFKMDRVKQTWKQNKAEQPQQAVGKSLTVKGISGKFLDTLLLLQPGDQIEVEAFHVSGSQLDFPGEWLKKVE